MRSRSVAVAAALTVLCASGAIGCYLVAASHRSEADYLLVRGNAEADQYARSFNDALAQKELATFEERRVLHEKARQWQMVQMLLALAAVMGLFATYVLFLFAGLQEQLVEAAPELADAQHGSGRS
jgi:hypothetical protein